MGGMGGFEVFNLKIKHKGNNSVISCYDWGRRTEVVVPTDKLSILNKIIRKHLKDYKEDKKWLSKSKKKNTPT